ncbi:MULTISPECIES: L-lactate permease [Myroides]|uniref:L-lactate permease n=1 Tax=Myroides albus TaxID=2562892 RepID=A0A6I3LKN1_9FLAO|nr:MULTISPECIES: L-lactate permease [Myroides]MTG98883.1 L-lactate permease [Myroides albus]MVX34923.1 L-lactate permease [Myroides sp. LoEW2-1]UVD79557.1 L-lactate permease [Myroides albus]
MIEKITALQVVLAVIPILLLIILLGVMKVSGHISALITLIATVLIGIFGFALPFSDTGVAIAYGVVKAMFPILLIILMAIYSYNVQVHTGKIEVIKQQFAAISEDKAVQVLLLTWGFGGLLEGMAGFGTAVAIPAAILISLGFKPIFSAVASLLANSVPTAFGAVGIPVIVLAGEVDMLEQITSISADIVAQLAVLMFLVPFMIVTLSNPTWKAVPKHLLLSFIVGATSLIVQYYAAIYIGAETPAILGSIAAIIVIILFGKIAALKQKQPKKVLPFTKKEQMSAWSVYGLILALVLITSPLFPVSTWLKANVSIFQSTFNFEILGQVKKLGVYWLTDTGVLIFISSVIGGLIQGGTFKGLMKLLGDTAIQIQKTVLTVCCLIALSTIMDVSGMITVLGVALATATGAFYPFFAPAIGAVGTFLTGSDTSSNILFGKLQGSVADQIGADKGWLAAANTTGATGGKIISPQSIAVATTACNEQGKEGLILKKAVIFSLLYIIIAGVIVYLGS